MTRSALSFILLDLVLLLTKHALIRSTNCVRWK